MRNKRQNSLFSTYAPRETRGYALLLSVLVSGLILAIGLGLLSIVEKNLILSSLGRESQLAFYTADSGGECGLYWDRKHPGFSYTVFATSSISTPPSSGVLCNGQDVAQSWAVYDLTQTSAKTSFDLTFEGAPCAQVTIEKTNSGRKTVVESRGLNTCDASFPRQVERALRISY